MMRISIRTKSTDCGEDLREYTDRRTAFALSRFANSVEAVDVLLEDVNGPRGGVDRRCRFIVKVRREPDPVVAETTHQDIRAAIDLTSSRIARSVARALDRRRQSMPR